VARQNAAIDKLNPRFVMQILYYYKCLSIHGTMIGAIQNMEKKSFSKPMLIIGGAILAVIIFLPSFYFYNKYQSLKKTVGNPPASLENEVKDLVNKVGKLIELPEGEDPTLATVSDKSQLPPQPFFARAQNGDKVLIYQKAKKAFLYRPTTDKLIEVGPVSTTELSPTVTPPAGVLITQPVTATQSSILTPTKTNTVSVSIYNGSKTAGLAAKTEQNLISKFSNISVIQKANSQGDYQKTLVVDLSGKQNKLASDMAGFLNGEVGSRPDSEPKPSADILIIVVE
jgi:hypothetical protein